MNFLGESASCGREHTDKSKLGPQRHAPLPFTRGTWALREGSLLACQNFLCVHSAEIRH